VLLIYCLFLCITAKIHVNEGENYILPDDISLLENKSIDHCTTFHAVETSQTPQYTTLRVPVIDEQLDYLSVALNGQNLTCGSNVHVMPLTASQTDRWTGIWHTCELITELTQDHLERCIFTCHCRGGCAQIQICKRPRTVEESSWVLCSINIQCELAGTLHFLYIYIYIYIYI